MKTRFTVKNLPTLPQGSHQDSIVPGLVLRVGKLKRSWRLVARIAGRQQKVKLGDWPALGLADARQCCRDVILRLEAGLGVEDATPEKENAEVTLGELINRYETFRKGKGTRIKRLDESLAVVRKNLGSLMKMPAKSLSKADLRRVRDKIGRRSLISSNQFLSYISPVLAWAAREDYIETNPARDVLRLAHVKPRERYLTDEEIRQLWQATDPERISARSFKAYCRLLRFALLTGQRRGECALLKWGAIKGDLWDQQDNKADRPHLVPITELAAAQMGERRLDSDFVFEGESGSLRGFAEFRKRLDRDLKIEPWRVHDLRRSFASGLERLRVSHDAIGSCLNHSKGPGDTKIYTRDPRIGQKRQAMQLWSDHVSALVGEAEAVVVPLRG